MGEHSRFSPSAGDRDTLCPPSFLINEKIPDRNSPDSAHGTAAHHLSDLCLKGNKDADLFAGCRIAVAPKGACTFLHEKRELREDEMEFEVDDEMVNAVQMYLDLCREIDGEHYYEVRVEHTKWCPDLDEHGKPLGKQYGTSDHICIERGTKTLYVDDLKYGKGVQVYAERNKQAAKYALGALQDIAYLDDIEWVVIRIIQPRLDHVDSWRVSVDELLAFGEQIKRELTEVFNPDAPFNPGKKQCQFCKISGACRPQEEFFQGIAALAFDDETKDGLGPPDFRVDPNMLTPEELAEAWHTIPLLKLRIEALTQQMQRAMLDHDVEMPGLKLVEGTTHRKWANEKKAMAWLKKHGIPQAKLYKKKAVSPNEAEKMLPVEARHALADSKLWSKPPGGPAIADENDKRPLYQAERDHSHAFEDEDDDGLD